MGGGIFGQDIFVKETFAKTFLDVLIRQNCWKLRLELFLWIAGEPGVLLVFARFLSALLLVWPLAWDSALRFMLQLENLGES